MCYNIFTVLKLEEISMKTFPVRKWLKSVGTEFIMLSMKDVSRLGTHNTNKVLVAAKKSGQQAKIENQYSSIIGKKSK